mgnify:CR=1 FL=1
MARFVRLAGFSGLLVSLDEFAELSKSRAAHVEGSVDACNQLFVADIITSLQEGQFLSLESLIHAATHLTQCQRADAPSESTIVRGSMGSRFPCNAGRVRGLARLNRNFTPSLTT